MNVSSQPLFASAPQPLKLPIPRLPSLPTSSWTSSSTSTHPIVPNAQQTGNATQQPTNKPQNKRGRKPLSSMPTTKKHIQNLTNQRAFRQRRETYIRSLESKALKFEVLLKDARNEVESLKEKVAILEEQVDIEERINNCNGVEDLQMTAATITDENIRINNIVHNDNINSFNSNNNKINDNSNTSCCGDQPSQTSRCFTPFTTTNTPPFSFNDQHRLINQSPQVSCGVSMLPSNVDDVIRDPIFGEAKESDLRFCEQSEDLINGQNITTTIGTDKCLTGLPTTIPSPIYPYSPNDSHLELSHQQNYFSPAVVTTTTNSFYPLNLKWILSDSR